MRLKVIVIVILFFNALSASSQERIWTKQTKISEIIAFEKEVNPSTKFLSAKVSLSKEYYPLIDKFKVTDPIIVQREPLNYLPLYAEYYYTPEDSTIRLISYDWEKDRYGNLFDKQKLWKQERTKLDLYNSEYERIKKDLLTCLGMPNSSDTSVKEISSDNQNYFSRETLWETNLFKATLKMIFASTTYRIRLTLYWK